MAIDRRILLTALFFLQSADYAPLFIGCLYLPFFDLFF
jgi:hypothetical protein